MDEALHVAEEDHRDVEDREAGSAVALVADEVAVVDSAGVEAGERPGEEVVATK